MIWKLSLNTVRPHIKEKLFLELAPPDRADLLVGPAGARLPLSRELLQNSDGKSLSQKGATSVIDGHAFEKNPQSHNLDFVDILKKLTALSNIRGLDPGFKSRVYEQFLRRDPNVTKVSGKFFTPRNVVRAIVQMGNAANLPHGAVICDPACGVGGFLTETLLALERAGIKVFRELKNGRIEAKYKFLGLDREHDIVCLAKSNFLLHTIEFFTALSSQAMRSAYQQLLSDTFIWAHKDSSLGSLYHPPRPEFDLIMANPPYIVAGTGSITRKIQRNSILSSFYEAGGSGLESRFVNWIVGSLRVTSPQKTGAFEG
jgi:type I restriction enzyme M protein